MSDIKKKIIQKMQSGGVTYRSAFRDTDSKVLAMPQQYAGQRGVSSGYGGKGSKSSSSKSDDESEMYLSHSLLLDQVLAKQQEAVARIDASSLSLEEKEMQIQQVMQTSRQLQKEITLRGAQTKAALDQFDKSGSRADELSSEYIVDPKRGYDPKILVAVPSSVGGSPTEFAFMNPNDAFKSGLEVVTVTKGVNYTKTNAAFVAFLAEQDINISTLIGGLVSPDQLHKDVKQFFDGSTITTSEDGTSFTMGGKDYNSANFSADLEGTTTNVVTERYLDTVSPKILARFKVAAASSPLSFPQYMNRYVMDRSNIKIDDDKVSGRGSGGAGYNSMMFALTGDAGKAEPHDFLGPLPIAADANKDKVHEAITRTYINTNRKTVNLPNGRGALDPNDKAIGGSVPADISPLLNSVSRTGAVNGNMHLMATGEELTNVLINKMGLDEKDAADLVSKIQVRVDRKVGISHGVGLASGNGESSRELERMFLAVNRLIFGEQAIAAADYSDGLSKRWIEESDAPSEAAYREENKDTLMNLRKTNTKAEIDQHVKMMVMQQQDEHVKKRFKEEIVEGDKLQLYFMHKEGLSKDKAEEAANKYKTYMQEEQFVVVPQLQITVDIPLGNDDIYDLFQDYHKYIGGTLYDDDRITDEDLARFNMEDLEGYYQTEILIDAGTQALFVAVQDGKQQSVQGSNWSINDPEFNRLVNDMDILYNTPESLDGINIYRKPVWNLLEK